MCIISLAATLGTSIATSLGVSVAAGSVLGTAVAGATAAGAATTISAGAAVGIGAGAIAVGALAIGGTIAGGVTGILSSVQQAEQQKQQAEYQAEIAEKNQLLANRRAETIELEANQKRAALLREAQAKRGTGRAGYAAEGVMLGQGTAAEYEADVANAYDLDLRNLNYSTASEAWQAKVRGVSYGNQAALYRAQAAAAEQSKTTSILGGAIRTLGDTASTTFNVATGLGSLGLFRGTVPAAKASPGSIDTRTASLYVPAR